MSVYFVHLEVPCVDKIPVSSDRVLYTPERLAKIAAEAAKPEDASAFSLDDRIGLVHDALALSKAGLAKLSSALTLLDGLKGEKECKNLLLSFFGKPSYVIGWI